jgi:putative membrane protein
MNGPLSRFLIRWIGCSLGFWIAAGFLQGGINFNGDIGVLIIAGFVLALANTIIKPLVVLLSLPAILFSLGLFMIVVNGLMVYLASTLYPSLEITSFGTAILVGVIIGVVNILISVIVEEKK